MYARIALFLLLTAQSAVLPAQEVRRSGGDAAARLQQQIQQLASERTALQSENARLKAELDQQKSGAGALAAEKDSMARRIRDAESKAGRAEASQQSARARADSAQTRLNDLIVKYRELAEQLRTVEAERDQYLARASASGQQFESCAQNNLKLAAIANEALDRYAKKGCFGALAQAEPFTGLKRVEVENTVEAYRQRMDSLQVPEATVEQPVGTVR